MTKRLFTLAVPRGVKIRDMLIDEMSLTMADVNQATALIRAREYNARKQANIRAAQAEYWASREERMQA
jgi:hypothetical protein